MNRFKEFGIKTDLQHFTGDKVKIIKVINTEIVVLDYKIVESKYGAGNDKCLYLQIMMGTEKKVLFTGSKCLIETIQQVPKTSFPFCTIIIKENERYEFS